MTVSQVVGRPVIQYPADGSVVPVTRAVWEPVELDLPATIPSPHLPGKRIVVLGGQSQVAEQVARTLQKAGAVVFTYPYDQNDSGEKFDSFIREVGTADGIIDLNIAAAYKAGESENWEEPLRRTVALLKVFYENWVTTVEAQKIFYMPVTRLGGMMGFGNSRATQPLGGIWAGLAKTLPREIPNCNIKILDLSDRDYRDLDWIIANEIYKWGLFEIGYRGGKRYTLACRQREAALPEIEISPSDTVLISGGGRGIGQALARSLTRHTGCRVLVTGRSALPAGNEPWADLNEEAFKEYSSQLFKSPPAGMPLKQVRLEIERIKNQRELLANLRQAGAEGLRIEYYPCDFRDPAQVESILEITGPRLTGIIHNAGVDTPVRLPSKTPEDFITTVSTKISSFLNLFESVKSHRLKFFCNVGSLTGRWGGMVGQLDYASANEGLARLGLWAAPLVDFPLKTLCWPTWDRLGMIANFEATLKYMSAVDVEEGVYHWQRELLTGGSGEVCFNGPVGKAFLPGMLRGFPPFSEVPESRRLYSKLFFTGEASRFHIFHSFRDTCRIDAGTSPCTRDFQVKGQPALPVSILLEYALSAAEWAAPEGWPTLYLESIDDLEVNLPLLAMENDYLEITKECAGRWDKGRWLVDVTLRREDLPGAPELATLTVIYSREPLQGAAFPSLPENDYSKYLPPPENLSWGGFVFKPAHWFEEAGILSALVTRSYESDLWTEPYLPELSLPVAALENSFKAAASEREANTLAVRRITFYTLLPVGERAIRGYPTEARWLVGTAVGMVELEIEGIYYR